MKLLTMTFACLIICCIACNPVTEIEKTSYRKYSQTEKDSLIDLYVVNGAYQNPLYSMEFQRAMDDAILNHPDLAYFYQQKSMPLFKMGKYEIGMPILDKAVEIDPAAYLDYRGFIKCIFVKDYKGAIKDFDACIAQFGNNLVMDHSYQFYKALSYLQLNEFAKAEQLFTEDIDKCRTEQGEELVHNLDLYYLGVSQYEQAKYKEAIASFDQCLKKYEGFTEAWYYKANSHHQLNDTLQVKIAAENFKKFNDLGYTINEDNAVYERYPYQLKLYTD